MAANEIAAWLIETSIAVSALILLVLALRKPVAARFGPEAAYLLWLAPALRLVAPELSILPRAAEPQYIAPSLTAYEPVFSASVAPASFDTAASVSIFAGWATAWAPTLIGIWGVGALAFIMIQTLRQRAFIQRLIAGSSTPSAELAAEAAVMANCCGLKERVEVRVAADDTGPLVAGLIRPVVIVPARFERDFSPVERQLSLAHEYAHIMRGDLIATFIAIGFRAAQWPNPLAHYAFKAFRTDQEAACDASVLMRNRTIPDVSFAYGSALVKAVARRAAPAACLTMSHQLKERIMLMKSPPRVGRFAARAAAAALVVSGIALTASYSAAAPSDEKKSDGQTAPKAETRSVSRRVISVDKGETLILDGDRKFSKVDVSEENGVRTVKLYDKDGKLVSERVFGPSEESPIRQIILVDKDGKSREIDLTDVPFPPMPPDAPFPPIAPGSFIFLGDLEDDHEPLEAFLWDSCDDGREQMESVAEEKVKDGNRIIIRKVACADGENMVDPARRAEMFKRTIERMEEGVERQREAISRMKEQLADAEKEAANAKKEAERARKAAEDANKNR